MMNWIYIPVPLGKHLGLKRFFLVYAKTKRLKARKNNQKCQKVQEFFLNAYETQFSLLLKNESAQADSSWLKKKF